MPSPRVDCSLLLECFIGLIARGLLRLRPLLQELAIAHLERRGWDWGRCRVYCKIDLDLKIIHNPYICVLQEVFIVCFVDV